MTTPANHYDPKFHQDGTITYWDDSRGWFHRVHPLKVPSRMRLHWPVKFRSKWVAQMEKLEYVFIRGEWVKRK